MTHDSLYITVDTMECLRLVAKGSRGPAPYGYRNVPGGTEPVVSEQEAIKLICELKGSGMALRVIAGELVARGVPGPKGKAWTHAHIDKIVKRVGVQTTTAKHECPNCGWKF